MRYWWGIAVAIHGPAAAMTLIFCGRSFPSVLLIPSFVSRSIWRGSALTVAGNGLLGSILPSEARRARRWALGAHAYPECDFRVPRGLYGHFSFLVQNQAFAGIFWPIVGMPA